MGGESSRSSVISSTSSGRRPRGKWRDEDRLARARGKDLLLVLRGVSPAVCGRAGAVRRVNGQSGQAGSRCLLKLVSAAVRSGRSGGCPDPRATPADPGSPGCQPAAGRSGSKLSDGSNRRRARRPAAVVTSVHGRPARPDRGRHRRRLGPVTLRMPAPMSRAARSSSCPCGSALPPGSTLPPHAAPLAKPSTDILNLVPSWMMLAV